MARTENRSHYPELVCRVLRSAHRPLTIDEILAGVEGLEPIHAAGPKALVRHIVEQHNLILPVDGERYGYLPQLLAGNRFRQPLAGALQARGFVELGPEVMTALWPGWSEARREQETRPADLQLAGDARAVLQRRFRVGGRWGFAASPEFWTWLEAAGGAEDDDLLLQVLDADARAYAGELQTPAQRDRQAIARRNRELADRAELAVRTAGGELLVDRLAPLLVATGAYSDPTAPDPLLTVLAEDGRFVDAGLGVVALLEGWTAEDERLADMRQRAMWEAVGEVRPRFRRASPEPAPPREDEPPSFVRMMAEGRFDEAVAWLQREGRIGTDEAGQLTVDLQGLLDDRPGRAGGE
jgi:hypothetical protein